MDLGELDALENDAQEARMARRWHRRQSVALVDFYDPDADPEYGDGGALCALCTNPPAPDLSIDGPDGRVAVCRDHTDSTT